MLFSKFPKCPVGGRKKENLPFIANNRQIEVSFYVNKVCYKVSLCENIQRQSCSIAIPLSNGPQTLEVNVTLQL